MPPKKPTSRPMKCYTCGETVTLTLDDTADTQRDQFATAHQHNPDWVRWLQRKEKP